MLSLFITLVYQPFLNILVFFYWLMDLATRGNADMGVAEFLDIKETLTSPTYSYIEEYDFVRHQTKGKFYHLDMWKVDSEELFERLEVKKLLQPGNVVVIEWWSQVKDYLQNFIKEKNISLIEVQFSDQNQTSQGRQLIIRDKYD